MRVFVCLLIFLLLVTGCSIQKMRYSHGLNIGFLSRRNAGQDEVQNRRPHKALVCKPALQPFRPAPSEISLPLTPLPVAQSCRTWQVRTARNNFQAKTIGQKTGMQRPVISTHPKTPGRILSPNAQNGSNALAEISLVIFFAALLSFFIILANAAYGYLILTVFLAVLAALLSLAAYEKAKKSKDSAAGMAVSVALLSALLCLLSYLIMTVSGYP